MKKKKPHTTTWAEQMQKAHVARGGRRLSTWADWAEFLDHYDRCATTAWLDRVEGIAKQILVGDPRKLEADKIIEYVAITRRMMARGLPVAVKILEIQQLMKKANAKVLGPLVKSGHKAVNQRRQALKNWNLEKKERGLHDRIVIRACLEYVKELGPSEAARQILEKSGYKLIVITAFESVRREIRKLRQDPSCGIPSVDQAQLSSLNPALLEEEISKDWEVA